MSKPTSASADALEALFAQVGWARRLARSLTADADEAEDLLQDTWIAAAEHPPDSGRPLRPWIAVVLRNRFLHRLVAGRRRQAREARHAPDDAGPSPQQLLETVQIQRLLADLVAGLPEPYRQTVILRYFEELPGAEIARRLGIPAGTVRWRLKTALDELKRRLDEGHAGDRSAWRAALLPLAAPPLRRPRLAWPVAIGLGGATLIVGLQALMPVATHRLPAEQASVTASIARPWSLAARLRPTRAVDLAACQTEVTRLRAERADLERERRKRMPPQERFWLGDPNPTALAALTPEIELAVQRRPKFLSHSLECRTEACRLLLISAARSEYPWPEREGFDFTYYLDLSVGQLEDRVWGNTFALPTPIKDQITGEPLTEEEVFLPLRDPSGAPRKSARLEPWPPPPAPPDGPLPSTAGACLAELERLRSEIIDGQEEREMNVAPAERFRRAGPSDTRTAELWRRHLVLAFPGLYTANFEVECHGNICRARWPTGPVRWHIEVWHDPWSVQRAEVLSSSTDEVYFELTPPDRVHAGIFLNDLLTRFERSTIPDDCAARFPATGTLQVRFDLHRHPDRSRNDEPARLTARFGHTLAGTPLGECLRAAIETHVLSAPQPRLKGPGAILYRRFDFPRAPHAPPRRSP
jgi:RNA polymerase sigma-70 factor (ECF subfamily)